MMNRIDTCGMSCPQPVLMTKKALENNPEGIEVLVDNNTSKNNVTRFLTSRNYKVTVKNEGNLLLLTGRK